MINFYFRSIVILAGLFSSVALHATDYYLKSAGAVNNLGSWGTNTNGTGTAPTTFANATDVWHFANRASLTLPSNAFNPNASASIVVESGFNLTLSTLVTITTPFSVASGGTLTIGKSNVFNLGTLSAGSLVVFSAATNIKGGTYGNISVANNETMIGDVTAVGTVTIASGKVLTLNSHILALQGAPSISGAGTITGDNAAGLDLSGGNGGNNGTLNFTGGTCTLNAISLGYNTGSDQITLGGDLSIENTGFLLLTTGIIDLNGNDMSVDASSFIDFQATSADGSVIGDVNSSIVVNGFVGQVFGGSTLFMNAADRNLASLVLNEGSSQITAGTPLTINDSLSILDGVFDTGSQVTINSTASRHGRISRVGGVISNDVTINTLITGSLTGWMFLGAPGVDNQLVSSWDTYVSSSAANGIPMTCWGCNYQPDLYTPDFASIQRWDEVGATYDATVNSTDALTIGKGFWVYVGDGQINTGDLKLINSGPPITGLTPALTTNTGSDPNHWNLIANPYASPISWDAAYALTFAADNNAVNSSIFVYSPDVGYGSYVPGVGGTNGLTGVLPAGAGFYVSAGTSGFPVIFDEGVKSDVNTGNFYRSSGKTMQVPGIKLEIAGQGVSDETMIAFHPMAKTSFDKQYDATKIFQTAGYQGYGNSYDKYTTLSSLDKDANDYSINTMGPLTNSVTIPLRAKVMLSGQHQISLKEENDFGACVILKDNLTNEYHDLRTGPYSFTISDTTQLPRFELVLCQSEGGPAVSVAELSDPQQNIQIGRDANSPFVKTNFEYSTKAVITAYNIVGQKVMDDVVVDGKSNFTRLDVNCPNQVVIIKVTTPTATQVKKIIMN